MKKLFIALTIIIGCSAGVGTAATRYQSQDEAANEARQALAEVLTLWRDGNYDAVYERTAYGGKLAKENFAKRLATASHRPVCCWEQLQEVKISPKDFRTVMVRGKVGLESGGVTEYRTKSFKIVQEDGLWRLSQSDILSLAEGKKKQKRSSSHQKKSAFTY
jgi:hypothetical protein